MAIMSAMDSLWVLQFRGCISVRILWLHLVFADDCIYSDIYTMSVFTGIYILYLSDVLEIV